jgi:hypothetical protein
MSDPIRDAIAAEIAKLKRETDSPTAALGFGTDVRHDGTDVDPQWAYTDSVGESVVQLSYLRLTTERGTLWDDPDFGYDLGQFLNRGVTQQRIREVSGLARLELLKDDRVADARVEILPDGTDVFDVRVTLTLTNPTVKPPTLTFALKDGKAQLTGAQA